MSKHSAALDRHIIEELQENIQRAKDKLAAYMGRCAGFADQLNGTTEHRNIPMCNRELDAYQTAYDAAQAQTVTQ